MTTYVAMFVVTTGCLITCSQAVHMEWILYVVPCQYISNTPIGAYWDTFIMLNTIVSVDLLLKQN